MREAVRSGRRANFFITENRFIDCYAKKVGGSGVAVYSILQRCANSETRETWIGADKMAEVLDMDRSTVYRYLKQLEDLRLIKTLRTREKTIYVVLPVPPPSPEAGSAPLFDAIEFKITDQNSTWPPVAPAQMSLSSEIDSHNRESSVASVQQTVASARPSSRTGENCNKEEQDLLNKTQEQDSFNKTFEITNPEMLKAATRIVAILGLPDICHRAALAAVEIQANGTDLSMDGVVEEICTDANHAERRGVSRENFLADFLARKLAGLILDAIHLPPTNSTIVTATAALKAEAKDRQLGLEQTAALITSAAIDDRGRGVEINRFYFENCKWRSRPNFLTDFLAVKLAAQILDAINLPPTNFTIVTVTAALKAEAKDRQLGLEQTAALITNAAIDHRGRGLEVNRSYFENCKWRNGNAGYKPSASQQRSKRTKQNILDGIAAEVGRRNQPHGPE